MHVAVRPRHVLSLCTGYGGLELAVRLACPGVRLVGACERQAYAAAILGSRMAEDALDPCPVWNDLETFPCAQYRDRVDLVVAGFPCQGASVAGRRRGIDDERWLWPEVWRITQEIGASWIFFENVPGLLSVNRGQAFEEVLRDLAKGGWSAEWDCLAAATVGAPHARDRVFLLAANPERVAVWVEPKRRQRTRGRARATLRRNAELANTSSARGAAADAAGIRHEAGEHGHGACIDQERQAPLHASLSDASHSDHQSAGTQLRLQSGQRAHIVARGSASTADAYGERLAAHADTGRSGAYTGADVTRSDQPSSATGDAADSDSDGRQVERSGGELDGAIGSTRGGDADRCSGARDRSGILDAGRGYWEWSHAPEPTVRGVDDGATAGVDDGSYADQLHLLGNGVVPHQAAVAFTVLWERLHGPTQPLSGDE